MRTRANWRGADAAAIRKSRTGLSLDRFRVGARGNSINPETGAPEFFLDGLRDWFSSRFGSTTPNAAQAPQNMPPIEEIEIKGKPITERLGTPLLDIAEIPIQGRLLTNDIVTNDRIQKLHPDIQRGAAEFINDVKKELGIDLRVTDGYRTEAEQDELYAQGRTVPGKNVTNARGGESYHNYGLGFDVTGLKGTGIDYEIDYPAIANIAKRHKFDWGGNWEKRKDPPHFERTYGQKPTDLIRSRPPGSPYPKLP
jgi:hypothetical protein